MTLEQAVLAASDRFWSHVEIGDFADCWPWKLCRNADGYGRFSVLHKPHLAHRIAFYITYRRWPSPCALHGCDEPPCCNVINPSHVHEGSQGDNAIEKVSRHRQAFAGRKLTDDQVAWVRLRAAAGEPQRALAAELGVAENTISRVVHHQTYCNGIGSAKGWKP